MTPLCIRRLFLASVAGLLLTAGAPAPQSASVQLDATADVGDEFIVVSVTNNGDGAGVLQGVWLGPLDVLADSGVQVGTALAPGETVVLTVARPDGDETLTVEVSGVSTASAGCSAGVDVDDDSVSLLLQGVPETPVVCDADADGVDGAQCDGDDCDDSSAAVYPGATERCDGLDNDCDGVVDGPDAVDRVPGYLDQDGDGVASARPSILACTIDTAVYFESGDDCDDSNAAVSPLLPEVCDGIDNSCGGFADESDGDLTCPASCNAFLYGDALSAAPGEPRAFDGEVRAHYATFGTSSVITDVDGDGLDDLLIAGSHGQPVVSVFLSPLATRLEARQADAVITFASGEVVGMATWPQQDSTGGVAVAAGGSVYLFSDVSSGELTDLDASAVIHGSTATFGTTLHASSDLSGDGVVDVIVGEPALEQVVVFAGPFQAVHDTASALSVFSGTDVGAHVAVLPDINADGVDEVVVGADDGVSSYASVHFSPHSATEAIPTGADVTLAHGVVAVRDVVPYRVSVPGDLDGDGLADVVLGLPTVGTLFSDASRDRIYGELAFFSGASLLVPGPVPVTTLRGAEGERLGHNIAAAGDVDGDGLADLLTVSEGGVRLILGGGVSASRVSTVWRRNGDDPTSPLGAATATGDLNGDGLADFVLTQPGMVEAARGKTHVVYGMAYPFVPQEVPPVRVSETGPLDPYPENCIMLDAATSLNDGGLVIELQGHVVSADRLRGLDLTPRTDGAGCEGFDAPDVFAVQLDDGSVIRVRSPGGFIDWGTVLPLGERVSVSYYGRRNWMVQDRHGVVAGAAGSHTGFLEPQSIALGLDAELSQTIHPNPAPNTAYYDALVSGVVIHNDTRGIIPVPTGRLHFNTFDLSRSTNTLNQWWSIQYSFRREANCGE